MILWEVSWIEGYRQGDLKGVFILCLLNLLSMVVPRDGQGISWLRGAYKVNQLRQDEIGLGL